MHRCAPYKRWSPALTEVKPVGTCWWRCITFCCMTVFYESTHRGLLVIKRLRHARLYPSDTAVFPAGSRYRHGYRWSSGRQEAAQRRSRHTALERRRPWHTAAMTHGAVTSENSAEDDEVERDAAARRIAAETRNTAQITFWLWPWLWLLPRVCRHDMEATGSHATGHDMR